MFSLLFELLGFGCGSGPLTARYIPPVGGFLYFLRPGTTKASLWPHLPIIGGITRSLLDITLYASTIGCAVLYVVSAAPSQPLLVMLAVLVPACGMVDKTLFLAARAEHYWTTIVVFALATDWWAAACWIQLALWFWAGVSKLNRHFPAVVCVMTSNSPMVRKESAKRALYRSYPNDLRPSTRAKRLAAFGIGLELSVPLAFLLLPAPWNVSCGLTLMWALHLHITSSIPVGVPLEWNVMVVYGAMVLFGREGGTALYAVEPTTASFLIFMLLLVPLAGNLFPSKISFLPSMRYYAGNWACSVWLFKDDSHQRLEALKKWSPWVYSQLSGFYDHPTCIALVGKVIAFRLMHLHGRAVARLIPRAVDEFPRYTWLDGEIVAGMALGWNFGDGHLHDERLLNAIQTQCGFEPGELRCIFVESQPLGKPTLHWRIHDAATGPIDTGVVSVETLVDLTPWGTATKDSET